MMKYRMTISMLFALLLIGDAYADTTSDSDLILARMFSPILILTKDEEEPSRRVIKPEPVEIVGANSDRMRKYGIGIADFDSLSATYGLIGIYRKSRRSSGFYGHRFRLTFPPGADVAAVAGAYWNVSYIQSVEPEPPGQGPDKRIFKAAEVDSFRIGNKLMAGLGGGSLAHS